MSKVPMPSSATWQIVCRHLIRGESKDWRPIGDEGYLCPECEDKHNAGINNIDNLEPMAAESVRGLRGVKQ